MHFYSATAEAVLQTMKSSFQGLSQEEAAKRLTRFGKNELRPAKKKNPVQRFFAQMADFMILILLLAAGVSFAVSFLEGNADYVDPIIILIIVVLNAVLGVIQETKAEHSLEALKKLSAPHAAVLRNGRRQQLPASCLVPGDLLLLETGCLVPADARLLSAHGMKADESALTGESLAVEKKAELTLPEQVPLGDRRNMVYSSSIITAGHGTAVVTATGMDTEVGHIAHMILHDETPETPLQKRLKTTGKLLGAAALAICLLIFLLGVVQGFDVFTMFMTSVSLAVASIPESLPAVVTIMLSLGVQRMAKKQAVIRKLPAVETLGSATCICSDKTGTLTQNHMTVTRTVVFETPAGLPSLPLLTLLCCNVSVQKKKGRTEILGEATEQALAEYALSTGEPSLLSALEHNYPRMEELPFDSARKTMSTLHRMPGTDRCLLITKGAFDVLLPLCRPSAIQARMYRARHDDLTSDALRVIAVGCCILPPEEAVSAFTGGHTLTLLGLFGLMDPPRKEAAEAVLLCRQAGITPIMITGDHKDTACAIGRSLGILAPGTLAMSGKELDALPEEALRSRILDYRVFARVSPQHKVRIVKALQSAGEVVAMTGDGVNDAPALKAADIGCAMGRSGTDVAKNAADMVLMDDNFATIVSAVREGRGIYENIKKSIHFLLSCNIGEIFTIFFAILFRLPSPLAAVQLLWVNLITDSLPAIALGVEPPEPDIMKRPPISPKAGMFSRSLTASIFLEGMMIGSLALLAYVVGTHYLGNASTMTFLVLSLSQLFHAFNIRSHHSLFRIGWFSNKKMALSFVLCTTLQLLVVTEPHLQRVFRVFPLTGGQWLLVLFCSFAPVFFMELQKLLANRAKPR